MGDELPIDIVEIVAIDREIAVKADISAEVGGEFYALVYAGGEYGAVNTLYPEE